jgi:hypothetical protein
MATTSRDSDGPLLLTNCLVELRLIRIPSKQPTHSYSGLRDDVNQC